MTVVSGLPAGALLTLEVGDEIPFVSRPIVGAPSSGERVTELLLDGQQRLTALWRSLTDDYPDRSYFVAVPEGEFSPDGMQIVKVARYWAKGRQYPMWTTSAHECWSRRLLPVRLLNPDESVEAEAHQWAEEACGGDLHTIRTIERTVQKLRQRFAAFNLPFLALPVNTAREVVLRVFVKMNTRSVRLTAFDIIVAQVEEATGESLHDLVEQIQHSVPELLAYEEAPEDLLLSVAALLQDRPPNQAGYFSIDLRKMLDDWTTIEEGVKAAIAFLQEEGVLDGHRLPTESVLAPLMALWANAPRQPDALGNTRILLRKYLWRAFFTDRYERGAATAALADYRPLKAILSGTGTESAVPLFDEAQHPLPSVELLTQARWPKHRDRLARAILALSLRGGAVDLADGAAISRDHLKKREYHHLYTVDYLREFGLPEADPHRALNCAVISWRTNRTISAKPPIIYLVERAQASSLGEVEIRRRLATHSICFDSLARNDYERFLADRAQASLSAVRTLCNGEQWTPRSDGSGR